MITSAAAVTSGAVTLSGSQPKRTEPAAIPRATTSTNSDEIAPPSTLMTTKDSRLMDSAMLKSEAVALARTASTAVVTTLSASPATMFSPTTVAGRRLSRNVPAWMAVPRRDPSAPKIFPCRAMAAGTIRRSPPNFSKRSALAPSRIPTTTLTTASRASATRLCSPVQCRSSGAPRPGPDARRR